MDFKTPGQLLAFLLKERGWTKRTLALVLGLDEAAITRLVSDKRPITAELALLMEEIFGAPAERFLELQKDYELALARISFRPDAGRANRAQIFGSLPIAEMSKRGWLQAPNVRDVAAVEAEVARFFNVERVDDVEFLPHAAKRTHVAINASPVQLAWLYRVRAIAQEMLVPKYSDAGGRAAIEKLRLLLAAPEELRKVPRILAEAGIRFVLVESLATAKIDGACLWLGPDAPVIGMSLRFDRIDNFWFVLRHELEHVIQRHGQNGPILDVDLDGRGDSDVIEEERSANAAALAFCVPKDKLDRFVARKAPFFAERDILGFAKTLGIHPGLVAGQLQHAVKRYDLFRSHLVKVREYVAPSAIVDGWGSVAPVGH